MGQARPDRYLERGPRALAEGPRQQQEKTVPDDRTIHREEAISRSFPIKDSLIYLQHTRLLDGARARAKPKWQLGAQVTLG